MELVKKDNIEELTVEDAQMIVYNKIPAEESWIIGVVRDIIDIKNKNASLENFTEEDLENMLDFVCTT